MMVSWAVRPGRRGSGTLLAFAALAAIMVPMIMLAGGVGQCGVATQAPGGSGGFEETAYGPPWGGIQGSGVTAYGVDLRAGQPMLEIAIDPTVLQPRAYYHVWPNPFGTNGAFLAGDTGGAIKGRHIDTYDWKGRGDQTAWGVRENVNVTKAADPGSGSALNEAQSPAATPDSTQAGCAEIAAVQGAPGSYVSPFRASTAVQPSRIDQGVDYSGTGPIVAIGDAVVTLSEAYDPGWAAGGGQPFGCAGGHAGALVYRLTDGPDQGRYVYVTEGIDPTVPATQNGHPTVLAAGETVGTFTGCIEIGWGSGVGDQPMAQVTNPPQSCGGGGDGGCRSSWCGKNMSDLIHTYGGPAGLATSAIFGSGC